MLDQILSHELSTTTYTTVELLSASFEPHEVQAQLAACIVRFELVNSIPRSVNSSAKVSQTGTIGCQLGV